MGVVGREAEHVGAELFDEPANRLAGERRKADALAGDVGSPAAPRSNRTGRAFHEVELVEPARHPRRPMLEREAPQAVVTLEDLVEDHRRQEQLGRVVHRDETQVRVRRITAHGSGAAPVVLEARRDGVVVAVHRDVHQQRHVPFSEASPDRIEVGMRERARFGISLVRVHHDRVATIGERLVEECAGDVGTE